MDLNDEDNESNASDDLNDEGILDSIQELFLEDESTYPESKDQEDEIVQKKIEVLESIIEKSLELPTGKDLQNCAKDLYSRFHKGATTIHL